MLSGVRGIEGLDRLDIRLVALLGLALLPIGLIAMVQTYRVISEADRNAEAALTGVTLAAATHERESLLRVRGAAQMASRVVPSLLDDEPECSAELAEFVNAYQSIAFAGFVDLEGDVRCASDGAGTSITNSDVYQDFIERPGPSVHAVVGQISNRSVVVVVEPVVDDGTILGYVALSVPQQSLDLPSTNDISLSPLRMVTFSVEGNILSSPENREQIDAQLPATRPLDTLPEPEPWSFHSRSVDGLEYFYTVAPLIPGEIYILAIWPDNAIRTAGLTAASAILFPLLMWLVTIGVAYFAVHRLVVRHIRYLRLRIRAFTANRRVLSPQYGTDTPSDLREVIEAFHQMTERIVRDEADLENSLHEKDVLLKEVHHRVKNNLQLIASMMSMQLRKSENPEIHFILRRLQDRVLGLATIHRNLYQASVLSRVNSSQLIEELVTQSVNNSDAHENGVDLRMDVDEVALYPDQAVPLSLLVTETITNALKYVGRPKTGAPWIELTLRAQENGEVRLQVSNSIGEPLSKEVEVSTGLGTQLMNAFSMQLDAENSIDKRDDMFIVTVVFQPSEFAEEP